MSNVIELSAFKGARSPKSSDNDALLEPRAMGARTVAAGATRTPSFSAVTIRS
jgi:hypothetical protein